MPIWKWGPDNASIKIAVPATMMTVSGQMHPAVSVLSVAAVLTSLGANQDIVTFSQDMIANPITRVICRLMNNGQFFTVPGGIYGDGFVPLDLPISFFSASIQDGKTTIEVVVPGFALAAKIADRAWGEIVLYKLRLGKRGIRIYDELARAPISQVRTDEGAKSASITLRAATVTSDG